MLLLIDIFGSGHCKINITITQIDQILLTNLFPSLSLSLSLSLSASFSYMFIFPEWFSPTRINKIKGNNVFVRLLLHILVPTCGTCCGMLNCMHECNRTKTLKVGLIYKTWKQGNCDIPVKTKYNEYTDKNSEMKIRSLVSSVCMLFLATMIRLMLSDGQKP